MKKIIAVLGILACLSISVAASDEWSYTDVFDYGSGILTIEGYASPDTTITINIPAFEKTIGDLNSAVNAGDLIVYSNDTKTNKDGSFSFKAEFDQSFPEGEYTVYIGSASFDAVKTIPVYFTNKVNYGSIISSLKNSQDIKDNAEKIGLGGKVYDSVTDKTAVCDIISKYNTDKGLSQTDSLKNQRIFNSAIATQAIKENKQLPKGWINNIFLESHIELAGDYEKYVSANEQYFLSRIKPSNTVEEFEDNILDALVLTVVQYPNGIGNIKTVFEKYGAKLGTNKPNTGAADLQDYSYIAGKAYSDVNSCIDDFNKIVNTAGQAFSYENTSSGGGTGGGAGSGNSLNVPTDYSQIPQTLSLKFEDLNSVPWAYKAISTLYESGIVSGKNEKEFYPNDPIKREEFIKLLVCMVNLDNEEYEKNNFSDIEDNAWYAKYVNIAYENNICKGIGDGRFGAGAEITREDMCVMVYNLMNNLGMDFTAEEIKFNDKDEFYDYSKSKVCALNSAGIVNGVGDNKFDPKGKATRAQAAVIIYNVLQKVNEEDGV